MKITYGLLCRHHACERQRNRFRELHSHGCQPTIKNLTNLAAETFIDTWGESSPLMYSKLSQLLSRGSNDALLAMKEAEPTLYGPAGRDDYRLACLSTLLLEEP